MRRSTRVCLKMCEGEGLALPAIVVVCGLGLLLDVWFSLIGWGATVRPYEWQLNYWLMLALATAYAVWSVLRARGAVDPAAGQWFVLAAYGLWMRMYCFSIVLGMGETFGDRSLIEDLSGHHGRVLIAAHRYGGLVAFAVGLAMVAGCARPISPLPGRAGAPRSARRRPAGRGGARPPQVGPPS